MPTTALRITETVSPSAIGLFRREVACAVCEAGADEAVFDAVRLCVSEALTNVVMHAYSGQSGLVEIAVELEKDDVVVTVRDAGCGLGGAPEHRDGVGGGLGLGLIGKLTDRLRVTSDSDRGTEVRMAFSRNGNASAARLMSL